MSYEGVPGLVETREAFGETTLVVDPARLEEACLHLRDEEGFNLLIDLVATDYLGWGDRGVAGYYGTAGARDLNEPAAQGYSRSPEPKPTRFSLSYLLIRVADDTTRVRVQVWVDDGQAVATVVPVWPTATSARSTSMRPAHLYTLNSATMARMARIRSPCSSTDISSAAAIAELACSKS